MLALSPPITVLIMFPVIGRNVTGNALFLALIRNIWSFGIAVVSFVCYYGGCKPINDFLSHKCWMPVAKLGFSLYLVHPVLQHNLIGHKQQPLNLDTIPMVTEDFLAQIHKIKKFSFAVEKLFF